MMVSYSVLPAAIDICERSTGEHGDAPGGYDVMWYRIRHLGWLWVCQDGTWIAEDAHGDYLEPDFDSMDAAVKALMDLAGVQA